MIRMIVGLGNPGREYADTRHNVGFLAVDHLTDKRGGSWKKWSGLADVASLDTPHKIILAKPQTYMNNSGVPVQELSSYYRIAPDELLVVYDDFALPLGTLRLRLSGSAGGHNGLSSIIEHLSTSTIPRLRLGIGPVPPRMDPADFVLGRFGSAEEKTVETMVQNAVAAMEEALDLGLEKAVSRISLRNTTEPS